MLQFLYKGVYNGLMPGLAKPDEHLMLDVKVYAIADKFGISELKDCAKGKFESHATDAWNSECFSQVVRAVYEMTNETDEDLRSIAIKIAGANASDLMDRGEFKELLKGNNEFAVAVLEQVVQRGTPLNPYTKPTVRPHTEPVKKPLERARHVTSEICANCVASHEWGTPPADFCSCCGGRLESKWH